MDEVEMTAEQKVKAKYPNAYAGCSWADGRVVAFIYNPSPTDGEPVISGDFLLPKEAWEDAASRIEAGQ